MMVFLVDDTWDYWFQPLKEALTDFDVRTKIGDGGSAPFRREALGFIEAISAGRQFCVVTDSTFGSDRLGGSKLLSALKAANHLKFVRGVVYSSDPHCDCCEAGRIETLRYKGAGGIEAEGRMIATFLRSGSFVPVENGMRVYVVDARKESKHDWKQYLGCDPTFIDIDQIEDATGPALVVVHGHEARDVQDLCPALFEDIAVIFVSGGGTAALQGDPGATQPRLYSRRETDLDHSLGDCLRRFWTICVGVNWQLPYPFELVEPPSLRGVYADVMAKPQRMSVRDGAAECLRRIKLFRSAGIDIRTILSEEVIRDTDETDLLNLIREAADAIQPCSGGTGEPSWTSCKRDVWHDHLLRLVILVGPEELKTFLRAGSIANKNVPEHQAMSDALEDLRGKWQVWIDEHPSQASHEGLKVYERRSEKLRILVDHILTAFPVSEADAKAVRETALRLNDFLDKFVLGCTRGKHDLIKVLEEAEREDQEQGGDRRNG